MYLQKARKYFIALGAFIVTFLLVFNQAFMGWDKLLSDMLYQTGQSEDKNIHIIGITEDTLAKYGSFTTWSREKSAELIAFLNQDKDLAPSVITFDIMFIDDGDPEVDARLGEATTLNDNLIMAANVQFKEIPKYDEDGKIYYDKYNIETIDFPIDGVKENVTSAFANTLPDGDGYVRHSIRSLNYEGQTYSSLAYQTYESYQKNHGLPVYEPEVDEDNLYNFKYTSEPNASFDVVSLDYVLNQKLNEETGEMEYTCNRAMFADSIVLVGAYALGMQDSYTPANAHGQQMNGVEIHANIINALMQETTQVSLGRFTVALICAFAAALACLLFKKLKVIPAGISAALLIALYLFCAKYVYDHGYIMQVLILPAVLLILYIEAVVEGYIEEIRRRRKIVGVFKQYMAPQIVDEISKQKDFSISLGGRKRHIAALFVDIRGFTTMSEVLDPEQVVEILNEYLALTTQSIFDNNGTLDKFVGDCTMAVFNSPIDLDDYIFRAVNAAWAMKVGSEPLSKKLEERFGRTVHFGIGVNCGDAVVGNIGCDFRMDYTAIGDTVNTAARLEANAKASQILISQQVLDAVKDRVRVTPIGEIPLKGKSVGIMVYQVDDVNPDGYDEEQHFDFEKKDEV